jgi:hypothetical protein
MKNGTYKLTVTGQAGYLSSGVYSVEVGKRFVHFRNVTTQGATFESRAMLKSFVDRGILKMETAQNQ